MTDARDELSPAAAGCMLLLWTEPTDRALKGWCPFPALTGVDGMSEETRLGWVRRILSQTDAERQDLSRGNT